VVPREEEVAGPAIGQRLVRLRLRRKWRACGRQWLEVEEEFDEWSPHIIEWRE